ncbi:MAG: hypothetical protein AAFY65_19685 [Pseudomonadota bacterium]
MSRPVTLLAVGTLVAALLTVSALLRPPPPLPQTTPTLAEALEIFDKAFPIPDGVDPTSAFRLWSGDEEICLIRGPGAGDLPERFAGHLYDLSRTFGLSLSPQVAERAVNCDHHETAIYVFLGANPGDMRIRQIMSYTLDTPGDQHGGDLGMALGFTQIYRPQQTIANPRPRIFVYSASDGTPIIDAPIQPQSIFLEEMLHALTLIADFETEEMRSITGIVSRPDDYTDWYETNARGYCVLDFVWLDLTLGKARPVTTDVQAMRRTLVRTYPDLLRRAAHHRQALSHLADPRC